MPPLVVTGVGSLRCDFPSAAQGSPELKARPGLTVTLFLSITDSLTQSIYVSLDS